MSSDGLNDLSVDEIQARLGELESSKHALEKALEQKRQQTKKDLAAEIKAMVQAGGYDLEEIVELLVPRRRSAAPQKGAQRSYPRYVDPSNADNVYVRGVIPGWMKDMMQARGLDPSSRTDRETFKAQHLERVDG